MIASISTVATDNRLLPATDTPSVARPPAETGTEAVVTINRDAGMDESEIEQAVAELEEVTID